MTAKIIIHGGLNSARSFELHKQEEQSALRFIIEQSYQFLQSHTALETVIFATTLLEDNPLFNAGTGSKIQSDGVIRMTTSVMDGKQQRFAGVVNIRDIKNPVQLAALLLQQQDRVLASEEALAFARQHGFAPHNPEVPERRAEYEARIKGSSGTVGCVALDNTGRLAAATSTGGKGYEIPGRVSDSATIAGNYANHAAAISCTGIGEDIVNAAIAASIATRVSDGMPLIHACDKAIDSVRAHHGSAALIALDAAGNVYHAATEPYLTYALHDGRIVVYD